MLRAVRMPSNQTRRLATLAIALLMAACSGYRDAREAQIAEQKGDWDTAVLLYLELADQHPDNTPDNRHYDKLSNDFIVVSHVELFPRFYDQVAGQIRSATDASAEQDAPSKTPPGS